MSLDIVILVEVHHALPFVGSENQMVRSRVGARVGMVGSGIIARAGLVKNGIRDEHLEAGLEMEVHQGARLQEIHMSVAELEIVHKNKQGDQSKGLEAQIFLDSYTEESLYRFSDYIGSNFQLEFILAVNSTASNGDSSHQLDTYQQVNLHCFSLLHRRFTSRQIERILSCHQKWDLQVANFKDGEWNLKHF
ncbi:hypothetical protein MKW98_018724 [Papaver atlanticum]|uniref:Uncharacterized protein n=1 Tax=Papaver atlanticum TaxID=357466 RepID=A0AAD4T5A6_9MAGN|nr:hypothetical protein MKW98_018724 [Papaver atlanticum]